MGGSGQDTRWPDKCYFLILVYTSRNRKPFIYRSYLYVLNIRFYSSGIDEWFMTPKTFDAGIADMADCRLASSTVDR